MVLFGLNTDVLYSAIAAVESEHGKTSRNVYQIRDIYVKEVNRILDVKNPTRIKPFKVSDKYVKASAEKMMEITWWYWGDYYMKESGKPVTYEVLARIHNGGPAGWKKSATDGYWEKVKVELQKLGLEVR